LRPSKHHPERDVEDHRQTEVADPAVFMQQAGNKSRGDAHQEDRQAETKNEDNRVLACGARYGQHVVERHREVSNDDLSCCLSQRLARGIAGDGTISVDIKSGQGFDSLFLLLVGGRAKLTPHLPAHPEQQNAAREQQADKFQELRGDSGKYNKQGSCARHAEQNRPCALLLRQSGRGHADDDGVVAGQSQVDHHDLEKRSNGLGCK
jgi:hypothetical protein